MNRTEKLYNAHEVASIIDNGMTANMVGRIANKNNLKTTQYGLFIPKIVNPSSDIAFPVNVFLYNELAIQLIGYIWNNRNQKS